MITTYEVYQSPTIAEHYKSVAREGLTMPEKYCLDFVPSSDRYSILDIGVGGGRTTGPLLSMFEKYIGIDYSEKMVAAAKLLYPGIDLRTMDARKLEFEERFGCVMFSFNGIDSVSYADRQLIYRQIAGILRPKGYFIYSTHNLHNRRVANWLNSLIVKELVRPLRGFLKPWTKFRPIKFRLVNFWRQSGNQGQPFAYVNDSGMDFRLLTTYVDIPQEIETLRWHGFMVVTTIGNTKQTAGYDTNDSWVYILAKAME
jgi:SAM-dependent methyltransferase